MTGTDQEIIASIDLKTMKYENYEHAGGDAQDFSRIGMRLFTFCVLAELFLASFHIWFTWTPDPAWHQDLIRFFHFDREGNLPTWFASTQFLVLALVFAALYILERYRFPEKHTGRLWLVCAAAAVFLSLDEAAALHELLGTYFGILSEGAQEGTWFNSLQHFPSYYWVLIYLPVVLPLSVVVFWFLYRELQDEFYAVLTGGIIYGAGAIFLDYFEGRYGTSGHNGLYINTGGGGMLLDIVLVEEFLEMFGISLIIYAFVRHLGKQYAQFRRSPELVRKVL